MFLPSTVNQLFWRNLDMVSGNIFDLGNVFQHNVAVKTLTFK